MWKAEGKVCRVSSLLLPREQTQAIIRLGEVECRRAEEESSVCVHVHIGLFPWILVRCSLATDILNPQGLGIPQGNRFTLGPKTT